MSINYAKQFTNIPEQDINIIMHSRKSLLFHQDVAWVFPHTDRVTWLVNCSLLTDWSSLIGPVNAEKYSNCSSNVQTDGIEV